MFYRRLHRGCIFVFLLYVAIVFTVPVLAQTNTAGFYLKANKTKFTVGETVALDVFVQSSSPINALSGTLVVPDSIIVDAINTTGSVIAFWTKQPTGKKTIPFEGVILGAPFSGKKGLVFHLTGHAKKTGTFEFKFSDGSALSGDGTATNILSVLEPLSISFNTASPSLLLSNLAVTDKPLYPSPFISNPTIPYISTYTPLINQSAAIILSGKGAPGATTQVDFLNVSESTPGTKFINHFTKDRSVPTTQRVTNDKDGLFSIVTASNLVAGSYMAVPSLVTNKEEVVPGTSILVMVRDNFIIRGLILVVNALLIIVPIVGLLCLIVYIPWYVRKRMHLARKRFELTEEKIDAEEKSLHTHE